MATILRGKRKGEEFTICQYCNDWVTEMESNSVHLITSVQFTEKEFFKVIMSKEIDGRYVPDYLTNTFKKKNNGQRKVFTRKDG